MFQGGERSKRSRERNREGARWNPRSASGSSLISGGATRDTSYYDYGGLAGGFQVIWIMITERPSRS